MFLCIAVAQGTLFMPSSCTIPSFKVTILQIHPLFLAARPPPTANFFIFGKPGIVAKQIDRSFFCFSNISAIGLLLRNCRDAKDLIQGKCIHELIFQRGLGQNRFLGNSLLQLYGRCGALEEARAVFDTMVSKNSFSWNLMLTAYGQAGHLKEALELFEKMPHRDVVSWTAMIEAFRRKGYPYEAVTLFEQMPCHDVVSWTAMITVYSEIGCLDKALQLFERMPHRNIVSWNAMITAYAKEGMLKEALQLFIDMPRRNLISWTAMMGAYCHHGKLKEACHLFEKMPQTNEVSWTAMIMALSEKGLLSVALDFFEQMPHRDLVSWNAMISACAEQGLLDKAIWLFDRMPNHDVVSWNAIIAAYAEHGRGNEAIVNFKKMQREGVYPDLVTLSAFLSACNHDGWVNEGCHCFVSMTKDYHMIPFLEHYNCLLDLLGRIGWLGSAEALINSMPFEPDITSWMALLASSKNHVALESGRRAAQHIFNLDNSNQAAYLLLSNLYTICGLWDEAARLRKMINDKHLKV